MNTRAKGSRLEAKSIAWLRADGATLVFRGKGIRRRASKEYHPGMRVVPQDDGVAQVDLIAFYPTGWIRLVEVTVAANRSRARKRLAEMCRKRDFINAPQGEVHVWKPRAKEPEREEMSR